MSTVSEFEFEKLLEELETLRADNAKLIAERDMYKNHCVAYECNCASCKTVFLGEKEQHICFKCLLAERDGILEVLSKGELNHKEAFEIAFNYKNFSQSNLSRCYLDLVEKIKTLEAEREQLMKQEPVIKRNAENWKYYQNLLKMNGFSGITDLLTKYRSNERELDDLRADCTSIMRPKHKRADELVVGDHIKKYGEVIKILQITNNGGYIKINFDETYLPPEAFIEMVYPLPAQQVAVPEVCAESQFEEYFEQIGLDAWEDHPVSQVYIDGFNCAVNLLSASQPKGESIERPANCRNRLHDEGKAYPRSGCYHCKTGGLTGCPFDKPKGDM